MDTIFKLVLKNSALKLRLSMVSSFQAIQFQDRGNDIKNLGPKLSNYQSDISRLDLTAMASSVICEQLFNENLNLGILAKDGVLWKLRTTIMKGAKPFGKFLKSGPNVVFSCVSLFCVVWFSFFSLYL